jgi:hypothetical protein
MTKSASRFGVSSKEMVEPSPPDTHTRIHACTCTLTSRTNTHIHTFVHTHAHALTHTHASVFLREAAGNDDNSNNLEAWTGSSGTESNSASSQHTLRGFDQVQPAATGAVFSGPGGQRAEGREGGRKEGREGTSGGILGGTSILQRDGREGGHGDAPGGLQVWVADHRVLGSGGSSEMLVSLD